MKLIKINTDHYVVVDDSEIKEGDWLLDITDNTIWNCHKDMPNSLFPECKKITHSTEPIDKSLFFTDRVWGCERLSLGEVKELIGEVDVKEESSNFNERHWQKYWENTLKKESCATNGKRDVYIAGYNQAIEDNKEKKYTEEDMWKAFEYGKTLNGYDWFGDLLESIQPKTEWEVEMVDGKLKLK